MGSGYICPPLSPYIIPMLYHLLSLFSFFLSLSSCCILQLYCWINCSKTWEKERAIRGRWVGQEETQNKKRTNSSVGPYVVAAGSFTPPSWWLWCCQRRGGGLFFLSLTTIPVAQSAVSAWARGLQDGRCLSQGNDLRGVLNLLVVNKETHFDLVEEGG